MKGHSFYYYSIISKDAMDFFCPSQLYVAPCRKLTHRKPFCGRAEINGMLYELSTEEAYCKHFYQKAHRFKSVMILNNDTEVTMMVK